MSAAGTRHVGWPPRLDGRGRTAEVSADRYLRDLVEAVLFTRPGERVNRPDFGSGVAAAVFEGGGGPAATALQALVHGALQHWLGELLRVEEVTVTAVEAMLRVTVVYSPAASPDDRRVLAVAGTP